MLPRARYAALPVHLAVYFALLLGLLLAFPTDGSFSSDDGAYAGATYALQNGSWSLDRPLLHVDSNHEGWVNSDLSEDGPLPYTRHPAYVYLLTGSVRAFGTTIGLGIPAAVGAAVGAMSAWLTAKLYDRAAAPLAFWIVALGPLLLNATTFWAHSLVTGLCGLSLWVTLRLVRSADRRATLIFALAILSSLAVLLRTDAILWFFALGASTSALTRSFRVLVTVGGALTLPILAFFADIYWRQSVVGPYGKLESVIPPTASWASTRLSAGFSTFLSPSDGVTGFCVLLASSLMLFAAFQHRRGKANPITSAVLVLAAIVFLVPLALEPRPISGLLAAWPILTFAMIAGDDKDIDNPALLYAPGLVVALLVFITQHPNGGGLEWGGRYVSTTFVGLGTWSALNLRKIVGTSPLDVLSVAVGPAILAVGVSYSFHVRTANFVALPMANDPDVVISNSPVGTRIAWSTLPTAWYTADKENVHILLGDLANKDVGRISVYDFGDIEAPEGYDTEVLNDRVVQFVAK